MITKSVRKREPKTAKSNTVRALRDVEMRERRERTRAQARKRYRYGGGTAGLRGRADRWGGGRSGARGKPGKAEE
ncbi:hypothetical protein ACFXPE_28405, partial [Streptomyces scopuliridis]|uniref:hypothetical protein n=1 Tax=Streptomyces scopuliridis TaxID=452529 RepID=UPI0036A396E0